MLFKERSDKKELLDNDGIPAVDLYQNLKELHTINRYLGGYKASVQGYKQILESKPVSTVIDIGSGGGGFIRALQRSSAKHRRRTFFYGVDIKQDCINYSADFLSDTSDIELICSDYRDIPAELLKKADVLHCSLFLHHLTDEEIVSLMSFAKKHNCIFLANDLERNYFAYLGIKMLTKLFSRSYLVKNDASLSVKRGFTRKELETLLIKAGYNNFSIQWIWAFRYLIIAYP